MSEKKNLNIHEKFDILKRKKNMEDEKRINLISGLTEKILALISIEALPEDINISAVLTVLAEIYKNLPIGFNMDHLSLHEFIETAINNKNIMWMQYFIRNHYPNN